MCAYLNFSEVLNFITVWLTLLPCCNGDKYQSPRWCFGNHKALHRYNILRLLFNLCTSQDLSIWYFITISVSFPPLNRWVRYCSCSQCSGVKVIFATHFRARVAQCTLIYSALVVLPPPYLIAKAPFGWAKHTHIFVAFPIINLTIKTLTL